MASIAASVAWWARTEPGRTALVYQDQSITYAELQRRIEAAAGPICAQGVQPGQVVALLMKNSAAFLELALAVIHAGAVLLPINYRLGAEEVAYILDHAGARLLFVDEELMSSTTGCSVPCVVLDSPAQADSRRLVGDAQPQSHAHQVGPADLYRLMYTSGTTDRPKGVMHTHANAMWKNIDHIAAL
ncbi:MAG TPA: AMP-binding protein, partial [Rhodocyclaceae bacterium]|nr:AMP-binding protein [Rhodocyclaceae bacterium]